MQAIIEATLSETLAYTPGHPSFENNNANGHEGRDAAVCTERDAPRPLGTPPMSDASDASSDGIAASIGTCSDVDEPGAMKATDKVCVSGVRTRFLFLHPRNVCGTMAVKG